MKKTVIVLSRGLIMLICEGALGAEWYVAPPPLGNNKNPGTEELPLATIQRGIDTAANGDTVIVAEGTYVENIQFKGKNIVLRSTNPADWTVVKETIIDGNKSGSVVLFAGTEDETCVLSGFTLRNGSGTVTPVPYGGTAPEGGGILGGRLGEPVARAAIQNNIITANTAQDGAGIGNFAGLLSHNIFVGNTATTGAGGAMVGCYGEIRNNIIVGNSAHGGGALWDCGGGVIFANNVVVGNSGATRAGGLGYLGTTLYGPPGGSIINCIIRGNTALTGPQVYNCVDPDYSCVQDWTAGGQGNLTGDPQFADPDGPDNNPSTFEDNDYHLLPSSPCIDAGTNEDWMNGAVDLDGKPRVLLGATSLTVDMGAYEYRFDFAISRDTESNLQLSWTMRPARSYTVLSSFDMILQPWTEETTILGGKTGGPAVWVDPGATSARKFYKIHIE